MKFLALAFIFSGLLATSGFAQTEIKLDNKRFSKNWFSDLDKAKASPEMVYYLDLSLQKHKEFPNVILEFKNVKELYLAVNYWPSIPDEIGKLNNLEILDLSSNYYLNTLPEGLAQLKNLKELHIKDNKLNAGEIERLKKMLPNTKIFFE